MEQLKNIKETRNIKVFLSSTFKDMQSERDYLARNIFMELEAYAFKKNVSLDLLDLRWGITEEKSKQGLVTQICLQEIDNSRPFFIGIIGERYGWIPDIKSYNDNCDLFQKYPWVKKDIENGLSITEIEIQYGVLRNEMPINAYFYIKETTVNQEIGDENSDKLNKLKNAITTQSRYPVKYYKTARDLGEMIKEDLLRTIDSIFPTIEESNPLKEADYLQNCILSAKNDNYVEIREAKEYIDSFLTTPYSGLSITGISGTGKSSLLANWISNSGEKKYHVLFHFVDKSIEGDNYGFILMRFYYKICEILSITPEAEWTIPYEEYVNHINNVLSETNEKFLFIIDALDQLDPVGNAYQLQWLPKTAPNVKVICSTSNDKTEVNQALHLKGFQDYEMTKISDTGLILQLSENYLQTKYRKELTKKQIQLIEANSVFHNPLYLFALFDELRLFGIHEDLNSKIEDLCSCENEETFFSKIISRTESDTVHIKGNIVKDILILLSITRNGIKISDIQKVFDYSYTDILSVLYMFHKQISILGSNTDISHGKIKQLIKQIFIESDLYQKTCKRYENYLNAKLNTVQDHEYLNTLLDICNFYYTTNNYKKLYHICVKLSTFRLFDLFGGHNNELYWKKLYEEGFSISNMMEQFNNNDHPGSFEDVLHEMNQIRALCANIHATTGIYKCLLFCEEFYNTHINQIPQSALLTLKKDFLIYHVWVGNREKVLLLADELLNTDCADDSLSWLIKAHALNSKAQFIKDTDIREASSCLTLAADFFLKANNDEGAIVCYINKGLYNAQSGFYENALKSYDYALDLCNNSIKNDPSLIIQKFNCLRNLSSLYARMGMKDKENSFSHSSKMIFVQILNSQYASRLQPSQIIYYHSTVGHNMMIDGKIEEGKNEISKGFHFLQMHRMDFSYLDFHIATFDLNLSLAKGYAYNGDHIQSIVTLLYPYEEVLKQYAIAPNDLRNKFYDYNLYLSLNCKDLGYTKAALYYIYVIINENQNQISPAVLIKCWNELSEIYLLEQDEKNVQKALDNVICNLKILVDKESSYLPNYVMALIRKENYINGKVLLSSLCTEEATNMLLNTNSYNVHFKQYLVLHILLNEVKNEITDEIIELLDKHILSVSKNCLNAELFDSNAVYLLIGEYCDNIGAYYMFEKHNIEKAIEYAQYSTSYFLQVTETKGMGKRVYAMHHLANYLDSRGNKEEAIKQYKQALLFVEECDDKTKEYTCRKSSLLYDYAIAIYHNDIQKAERLLRTALNNLGNLYLDDHHASRVLADIQEALGNLYDDTNRYDEAEEMYKSATFILEKYKDLQEMSSRLGKVYNNYGIMLIKQGEYDKAMKKLLKSREIRIGTDNRGLIQTDDILYRLSCMYNKKDRAFDYLAEIIETEEKYNILACGLLNEYVNYVDLYAQLSLELHREIDGQNAYKKVFMFLELSNMGGIPSDSYLNNLTTIIKRIHELFGTTDFLNH